MARVEKRTDKRNFANIFNVRAGMRKEIMKTT